MQQADMERLKILGFSNFVQIGAGSFSKVFRVSRSQAGSDGENRKKFNAIKSVSNVEMGNHEGYMLLTLSHPNIVKMETIVNNVFTVCLVLEYCNSSDLEVRIQMERRLREPEIRLMMQNISSALVYLKEENICHLDLKPRNIMIDRQLGQTRCFKLTDFGLAQRCTPTNMKKHMICGTFPYMAPERIRKEGCDFRSDIWSFGVTVAQCLFGKLPHFSDTFNSISVKINSKTLLSFPFNVIPVSDELKDILLKLVIYNPDGRITLENIVNHKFLTTNNGPVEIAINLSRLDVGRPKHQIPNSVYELKKLTDPTPKMNTAVDMAIMAEEFLVERDLRYLLILKILRASNEVLYPMFRREPNGPRKELLLTNITRWKSMGDNIDFYLR